MEEHSVTVAASKALFCWSKERHMLLINDRILVGFVYNRNELPETFI